VGVILDLDNTFFIGRHVLLGGHDRLESSCIQVTMVCVNVRKVRFRLMMVKQSHGHSSAVHISTLYCWVEQDL
jgi:hypothetical protein